MDKINEILKGAYDLHLHTGPDVVRRSLTDVQMAKEVIENGMRGFVIKSHYFNTAGRAALIREMFPQCNAIGAVVLNNSVGGINPHAVEMGARAGAKVVWFPTMDAKNMWDYLARSGEKAPQAAVSSDLSEVPRLTVFDENGELTADTTNVLKIIKKYDLVLATGHISPSESLALVQKGQELGLRKMIVTHVEFRPTFSDIEMQKKFIEAGAFVEHNYITVLDHTYTLKDLAAQIRAVGPEHVILSTDLGQYTNPKPIPGMKEMLAGLLQEGITEEELRQMLVENTRYLVE